MTGRVTPRDAPPAVSEADLGAFFRHRDDVPAARGAALTGSLSQLRGSDDPAVTFAGLPAACVPEFADGCQVELSDGAEPPFRVARPERPAAHPVSPEQLLLTPFRVASRTGYPPYGGIVTHWWTRRTPAESDAVIAELMVRHLIALVDRERLMAAVARAEDQAASLALEAISGRTINIATGIVMHQHGLAPGDAEDMLRQSASVTGTGFSQVAASVVRFRGLQAIPEHLRAAPASRQRLARSFVTGGQRKHAGTQQPDDPRRVGGGEFVGLDEVPGDRDAEGDGADDRGSQVRVVGEDGPGDLRLVAGDSIAGGAGGLGIGQHRAQEGQRRRGRAGEPVGERGEDLLGCLRRRPADLRDGGGVDHSPVQLLLGPEVVHDQARVDSCGRGHGPDGSPVVSGAEEDLGRGVEDARFGAKALLGTRTRPGSGHCFILRALTGDLFDSTLVQ
jgi:hypothetical protein